MVTSMCVDRNHFWRGITYLAFAVLLTSGLPGVGEFRCRLGMAEAGPECPVCHDSDVRRESSTSSEPCCEFVTGTPSPSGVLTTSDPLPAPSACPLLPVLTFFEPTLRTTSPHKVVARDIGPPDRNKPLFLRL